MENTIAVMSPLQPELIAEAFSFMPLNCFQSLTVIASAREGSHLLLLLQKSSQQKTATAKRICLQVICGVWQLLLADC